MTLFALGNLLTLDSGEATNDDPLRSDEGIHSDKQT